MIYNLVLLFDTYLGFGITLSLMLVTDGGDEICNKLSRFRLTFEKNVVTNIIVANQVLNSRHDA